MASTLILARLLKGRCPSVPRSLLPVLCGGSAGPGFARACLPRHITAYDLEIGPWAMFPHSFSYHPPTSHGMSRLVGVLVCVFIYQPPWLLILSDSQVSHTRSPSLLRLNLLLIPKVNILSEQMEFCFSQNTFFLILTKE